MVAEEVVITLSGGGPWGFRLQGGAEHKKPLQVAKVRKRSKACRAGLREGDELVSINEKRCGGLSHAQAMDLIDSCLGTLRMSIKRAPAGFQSVVLLTRAPSPRVDKEYRASLRALSPPSTRPMQVSTTEIHRRALMSPDGQNGMIWSSDASEVHQRALMSPDGQSGPIRSSVPVRRECLTSPPNSEAYYGETDSDADTIHERQRRQKRRSPNGQLAKLSGRASLEEETSEMSGYESAGQLVTLPGVPRREVVYQPPVTEWASPVENGTEESCASADEQGTANRPRVNEVDSGFQEPTSLPPLVPPERAREALLLASGKKLVPMVGPVDNPVEEELTVTYMDKAKQAKLHRGESTQEKQVKEARTKCRTIASLLTDAPNPHSKGVLMFKKRRQRAKRYTLTCFGSVNGDLRQGDAEEEEEEEEEEDGIFLGSESELDEDGFAAALDSTWDSDYLDVLERRTPGSAVAADGGGGESPSLSTASGKGAQLFEQQRKRVEGHAIQAGVLPGHVTDPQQTGIPLTEFPTSVRSITGFDVSPMNTVAPVTPITPVMSKTPVTSFSVVSGNCVSSSKGGTVVSPPVLAPMPACAPPLPSAQQPDVPCSSVINRTAQPFAPGFVSHRSATAPVVFQPNMAKKAPSRPAAAKVSAANSEVKRAVSVTSLYIPARLSPYSAPPSVFSPTSSVTTIPFMPPPAAFSPPPTSATPFSPTTTPYSHPSGPVAPSTQHATPYSPPSMPVAPSTQHATPYSPPSGPVAPSSQPATPYSHPSGPVAPSTQHATPYSPPSMPVAPSTQPATPYSPPSMPVAPSSQHATPYSPPSMPVAPSTQHATPYSPPSMPVAPSTQHATPYSPPSGPVAPFSGPNNLLSPPAMHFTQPASIHSPSLPSPFVNSSQPTQKVSFNPYITVATSPSAPVTGANPSTQSYPIASSTDPLASREQRIAVPAARTGLLQEARRRGAKKPMFSLPEEKKTSSPNPELLSLVQNLDERPRAGNEAGFESGPEEDLLNLGAEACNFMQAQRNKPPPPVVPKMHTVSEAPQIPQMGGKGAELFARRQSRMDRYTVDSVAPQQVPLVSPREPRLPSPTPSMPALWKYSPNIRAPPPISYNPLLSPSCPPLAQRGSKPSEAPRVAKKGGAQKQGIRALDFVSHQPYQLNTALFCYGGGVSQPLPSQQSPGQPTTGTLTAPKQVPVKAARVYEIKRFSTPTPTSAPTSMGPALIVPRSATTLGEPIWHINEAQSPAVLSPPAQTRVTTVPELPKISTAPIPGPAHIPVPVQMPGSAYVGLQATKQFKSAPELSPLPPSPLRSSMSGSSTGLRVPRPQFSTSRMGIQANVWRPGSMHC